MLIKPFTGGVNASGQGIARIRHDLHGIVWKVFQIGFGLGILAASPQVAAHVNGIPLSGSAFMQQSVFSSVTGEPSYAMESFFVGPPYILLSAGDTITCAVLGAASGDVFTAGAYLEEHSAFETLTMGQ